MNHTGRWDMTIPAWVMQLTAVVLLGGTVASPPAGARTLNGFDLSDASVPADDVFRGGPPRDGIPALTNPHYVKAAEATFLESGDRILGARRSTILVPAGPASRHGYRPKQR